MSRIFVHWYVLIYIELEALWFSLTDQLTVLALEITILSLKDSRHTALFSFSILPIH